MYETLLIEIGVEELPAIPFLKELPNIPIKWKKVLQKYGLESEFVFYYTPRRLIISHNNFKIRQDNSVEKLYGAPLEIAYKDGQPTKAALSFAKKCGVDVKELKSVKKGNKEVLFFEKVIKGKDVKEILPLMIDEFLSSLHFGKAMRWSDIEKSFIRPIRWIGCMLGKSSIDFELFKVKSSNYTYPHRSISYDKIFYSNKDEFFDILEKNAVIVDTKQREKKILKEFEEIEKEGIKIQRDKELLDEVVTITEYPTALKGSFDERFLTLPPEVIITSMKEHQRYFPVFKDDKLANNFIVVSNAFTHDFSKIIAGNEKVLRARLSDAMFFWENDIKKPLSPEPLKDIIFMKELGSMYDKEVRESKIAYYLNKKYSIDQDSLIKKAIMLSKADLVTDMVYEFTELQGLMGYYYAKEQGLDEKIALAIKEQYLPDGEDSPLPSTDFSALIALSYKIDSLLSLFSIRKIPTGTKDPFALRRAVIGIIKIILDREFSFDIKKDLKELAKEYKEFDFDTLERFILERIVGFYDVNPSIVWAVLNSDERDIKEIDKKIKALSDIVKKEDFKKDFSTFKRVANIVKDLDLSKNYLVDETLFEKQQERVLYDSYKIINQKEYDDYLQKLEALFGLKPQIDDFFDNVMVNDKDEKIKNNRKALIATIYKAFKEVADIKDITI